MRAGAAALLFLLASAACSAEASETGSPAATVDAAFPARPDGPVLDQADVLPEPSEAALDLRLRRLFDETGDAVVVVTVLSLGGQSVEKYAYELFNTWGIGDAQSDRGLLILIAPYDRSARIEIGCGLVSSITDEVAANIMQERMLPKFGQGDFSAGIEGAVDDLTARLKLPAEANPTGPYSELCKAAENAA